MKVRPGDTCNLAKGDYLHDGITRVHGEKDARITIRGETGACIRGSNTQDRVLQIAHDYYTVENLCFDGEHNGDFVATAVYVLGADKKSTKNGVTSSVTGLRLANNEIKNFNSECIHFRYFVTHAEVYGNTVQHCGREDFDGGGGGKVGEGLYLGTAPDQVDDNKARRKQAMPTAFNYFRISASLSISQNLLTAVVHSAASVTCTRNSPHFARECLRCTQGKHSPSHRPRTLFCYCGIWGRGMIPFHSSCQI